jgi:feruloyl esterase
MTLICKPVSGIALSSGLVLLLMFTAGVPLAAAASCESVAAMTLTKATITSSQNVPAGAFTLPTGSQSSQTQFDHLPAFCRVTATLKPSADSDIRIEVWMPVSGWNGKLQAVGNGGWSGAISYQALATALAGGYAGASTDTGHRGNVASFALGHPEQVVDMSYRAVHEMTVQAKAIIRAYYGNPPKISFWNGCSTGGRQGITEAAKYPADFNGIVVGAPAIHWINLNAARMMLNAYANRNPEAVIPPTKYPMIHELVLKACDALDGVKDGVVENPARCHFNPEVLACTGSDGPTCLSPAQVETARAIYSPVKNPRTGEIVMPALLQPGSELGWGTITGPEPISYSQDTFKYLVFKDPAWDWRRFNPATDIDLAIRGDDGVLNFTDANLKPFFQHGGKLLMYHGWSDQDITPISSIAYFQDVTRKLGSSVAGKSIELYLVPGMNHCGGGPGTDTFDKMDAIEEWVSKGTAPDHIVASHRTAGKVDRTRPLCPYGKVATYSGKGSTDDAANFTCKARGWIHRL